MESGHINIASLSLNYDDQDHSDKVASNINIISPLLDPVDVYCSDKVVSNSNINIISFSLNPWDVDCSDKVASNITSTSPSPNPGKKNTNENWLLKTICLF